AVAGGGSPESGIHGGQPLESGDGKYIPPLDPVPQY
ncbi:hypothetical protein A2U01_0079559, partial [Trifolium medium]|nr:hypothetical protein [Trifolium medium]